MPAFARLHPGGRSIPLLAFGGAMTAGLAGGHLLLQSAPPVPSARPADPASEVPLSELDDRRELVLRTTEEKRAVARRVVDGSRTLLEAAADLRRVHRQSPHFHWGLFRQRFPDVSDDERHCRAVIVWVEHVLAGRPKAAGWVARLEEEVDCLRACGGLRLPGEDTP